jgi:S-adenosylmethionine:tRNA ribosyltransferase-isomerase
MKVSDYDYELPERLIAQFPPKNRTDNRLLKVGQDGVFEDSYQNDILDELNENDLLVLNDTKVIPARVFGNKESGGKVEILLERIIDDGLIVCQMRSSKSAKLGTKIFVESDTAVLEVVGRQESFFKLKITGIDDLIAWFEKVGHMPLPPYISRSDQLEDADRYQTVFAKQHGAVAAPTAGLHFDALLLDKIRAKGVRIETITLHVGAGTYQPVRAENIEDHTMHAELIHVNQGVCDAITETKTAGGKVVAVGTTVVRSLESAARAAVDKLIEPYFGETDIFIFPGFEFKVVDILQTNFHLPQSTLLMLVSAFAGQDIIKGAYQHAITEEYRFFSYGDAMLLYRAN